MDKQKLMLFSERKELAEEYEKWINTPLDDGSKIKDCALSVITFMQIKGFCKIPEGSVVLTREENEKWLDFLELNMSKARQRTVKEVLQKVKSYTLDKEVGMKYLLKRLGQEYGVEIE